MEKLKEFTNLFTELKPNEFSALEALFEEVKVAKMDHLLVDGTFVKDLFFINEGVFRVYHLKDGEEFTTKFLYGPCIYAELFSLRRLTPTFFNIQALTPCECYKANFKEIEKLMENHPGIRRLFLKLYEYIYMNGVKRQVSFILDSQSKRYNDLIATFPNITDQIPLQYIASFIGMKPETLSRIRKKSKR